MKGCIKMTINDCKKYELYSRLIQKKALELTVIEFECSMHNQGNFRTDMIENLTYEIDNLKIEIANIIDEWLTRDEYIAVTKTFEQTENKIFKG